MSDDITQVETYSHKRDYSHSYNIISDLISIRFKQSCYDYLHNDDFLVASPSVDLV
jgi:hypothetical protein